MPLLWKSMMAYRMDAVFALLALTLGSACVVLLSPLLRDSVPLVATITTDHDHPGYEFFLVNWSGSSRVERLELSATNPARVLPDGRIGAFREWTLHAVPTGLLAPPDGSVPTHCEWFVQPGRVGVASFGELDFGGHCLPFHDDRDRVEVTYRVDRRPYGWRLVKVEENAGNPWARWGRIGAVALAPAGLAVLALWWTYCRMRRSSSGT